MEWILQIPVLFFSIVFHEFSHGWVAHRRGDDTAYLSGRLTLNPFPHIDLMGTIILPAMCIMSNLPVFGWAKPVPVNPLRLQDMRKDMARVAVSGPASNFLLAVIAAVGYRIALVIPWLGTEMLSTVLMGFRFAVMINLSLAFFNLIPLAPLDGSQIASALLPRKWLVIYERHVPYGGIILISLMLTGVLRFLIIPPLAVTLEIFAKLGLAVW